MLYKVEDKEFRKYGRIVKGIDFGGVIAELKKLSLPEGVIYEPSVKELEALPVKKDLENKTYGELPIQIGYCIGHNCLLNAVEYHRSSEINIAAKDAILQKPLHEHDLRDICRRIRRKSFQNAGYPRIHDGHGPVSWDRLRPFTSYTGRLRRYAAFPGGQPH